MLVEKNGVPAAPLSSHGLEGPLAMKLEVGGPLVTFSAPGSDLSFSGRLVGKAIEGTLTVSFLKSKKVELKLMKVNY